MRWKSRRNTAACWQTEIGKASVQHAKVYVDKGRSSLAKADVIRGLLTEEDKRPQRAVARPVKE